MGKMDAENVDGLTGFLRHDAFAGMLDNAVADADEEGGCVSCAVVDLDFFKKINDEHGHEVGDEVLKSIAACLAEKLSDGMLFRYGGDELVALLPGVEKEQALLRLEEVRKELDQEHTFATSKGKAAVAFTVSVGVAAHPDDSANARDVLRKATEAMYRAKTSGHNKVCLAREEKMVTKTSHYTQGQLARLRELATKEGVGDAVLLREALDELFEKYDRKV